MTLSPLWFAPRLATSLIGSGIDVSDKHVGADLRLHEHRRICRRCAAVDVQRNDDRAKRDVPIARDRDVGPAQKVTLDLGQGVVNARQVSDNKIQLKFRTKDFEGEYFHYTGDLF